MSTTNANIIARKNDLLRSTLSPMHGRIILTRSVHESEERAAILEAVRSFTTFTGDNDPYGERDFGAVDVAGKRYFWKVDYYDKDLQFFQHDGHRVLTIMQADEY